MNSSNKCNTESGSEVLVRLAGHADLSNLGKELFLGCIKVQDVIEISGGPGVGKTELLLHLISQCVLPVTWNSIPVNGLGRSVILIDSDQTFDLLRLIVVMEGMLKKAIDASNSTHVQINDRKGLIETCLKNVLIMQVASPSQFEMTLRSLQNVLVNCADVALILIDSISAFYWINRMIVGKNTSQFWTEQRSLIDIMLKLIQRGLTIVMTKQTVAYAKNGDNQVEGTGSDFKGRDWQKLVTMSVTLQPSPSCEKTANTVKLQFSKKNMQQTTKFIITASGIIAEPVS